MGAGGSMRREEKRRRKWESRGVEAESKKQEASRMEQKERRK